MSRVRALREAYVECARSSVCRMRVPREGHVEWRRSIVRRVRALPEQCLRLWPHTHTHTHTHGHTRKHNVPTLLALRIKNKNLYSVACVEADQITKRVYVGDRFARSIAPVPLQKHRLPPRMCMCVCVFVSVCDIYINVIYKASWQHGQSASASKEAS
jgi:hypothetical protein